MREPNTGRRSNEEERAIAQNWVNLYRQAQKLPDGRLCLNPKDEPELQTFINGNDPEHLLRLLEGFAEHGALKFVGSSVFGRMLLRMEFNTLRQTGHSYEKAIGLLADRYHKSARTIARDIAPDKS